MGNGIRFCCNKCGYETFASYGIGFLFPQVYRETVEAVRAGRYGQEWKELFENTPGAAVNAEQEFYACPYCGGFVNEPNLTIYAPKAPGISKVHNERFSIVNPAAGSEYVTAYTLGQDYRRVKTFVHKCPECGKRMHRYRGDELKCPECKAGTMEKAGVIMWD